MWLFHTLDLASAVLDEGFFHGAGETGDLAAASTKEDMVAHLLLELGVVGGDQVLESFDRRLHDAHAGFTNLVGDVELSRLALDGEGGHDRILLASDAGKVLFDFTHHVYRELGFRVLLLNQVKETLVDGISTKVVGSLVVCFRHRSMHSAQVDGSCSDVNHECVGKEIQSISHGEGFRADDDAVHEFGSSFKNVGLGSDAGFCRCSDDSIDSASGRDLSLFKNVLDQVTGCPLGILVFTDDTLVQRADQIDRHAVLNRFFAEDLVSAAEQLFADVVLSVAHI